MLRKGIATILCLLFVVAAFANSKEQVNLKGYLVDMMCANSYADDPEALTKAKEHTKECSLMAHCIRAGYAVMTEDGKIYKLDKAGNKKVAEILDKTKDEQGLLVSVEGRVKGNMLYVKSIAEVVAEDTKVK
ncbi:MAG: hypothetical protein AABO57_08500 [Acidobacteriota bacterium]